MVAERIGFVLSRKFSRAFDAPGFCSRYIARIQLVHAYEKAAEHRSRLARLRCLIGEVGLSTLAKMCTQARLLLRVLALAATACSPA